ncbi:MAG: hypothetical protein ABW192_02140 [Sphingobium sp.]
MRGSAPRRLSVLIPVQSRMAPLAVVLMALAGCAPGIVPDPGGRHPSPEPAAPSSRPVAQAPDWQDWPLTAGTWTYARMNGSTMARLTSGGVAQAWVRCDLATRVVAVGRATQSTEVSSMMTVRTSFGAVEWPARAVAGTAPGMEAVRTATDPGLDQIAFSRGRFALTIAGQSPIVAPTWAEPVRVIEDCRG